jgi:sortase A
MADSRHSRLLHLLEWVCATVGFVCLLWYSAVTFRAAQFQHSESARLDRVVAQRPAERPTIERPRSSSTKRADHAVIGRLEIPRVNLSVMVVNGDDEATLQVAAGHLPDTPLPWELGNSAVAGHRDSFFRPLSKIKLHDTMTLTTPHGEFHYAVSSVRVVEPNDLSVLAQYGRSSLTLVTCYPFSYVGRAPKRFIVRADHVPS